MKPYSEDVPFPEECSLALKKYHAHGEPQRRQAQEHQRQAGRKGYW
jgi:hypothetical protein